MPFTLLDQADRRFDGFMDLLPVDDLVYPQYEADPDLFDMLYQEEGFGAAVAGLHVVEGGIRIGDAFHAEGTEISIDGRTGDVIDFEFELHPETGSPVRVAQLLDAVLGTLDREIQVLGETSNGDILQALAMALAARARMIHAPVNQTSTLARALLGYWPAAAG